MNLTRFKVQPIFIGNFILSNKQNLTQIRSLDFGFGVYLVKNIK